MSNMDRRQFLKGLLGALAQGAGTVVLASSAAKAAQAGQSESGAGAAQPLDVQQRADELAMNWTSAESSAAEANEFLNVGFGPSWRNGGWPNGGWRNLGWHNGGWRNGWRNGGWRNGGWPNRGWPNRGWRNGGRRR